MSLPLFCTRTRRVSNALGVNGTALSRRSRTLVCSSKRNSSNSYELFTADGITTLQAVLRNSYGRFEDFLRPRRLSFPSPQDLGEEYRLVCAGIVASGCGQF